MAILSAPELHYWGGGKGEIETCAQRVFCRKLNSEQLLFEGGFNIIGIFCSVQLPSVSESTFLPELMQARDRLLLISNIHSSCLSNMVFRIYHKHNRLQSSFVQFIGSNSIFIDSLVIRTENAVKFVELLQKIEKIKDSQKSCQYLEKLKIVSDEKTYPITINMFDTTSTFYSSSSEPANGILNFNSLHGSFLLHANLFLHYFSNFFFCGD